MKLVSTAFLYHDSGISFLDNGSVIKTILSERITRKKHNGYIDDETIINQIKETNSTHLYVSQQDNTYYSDYFWATIYSIQNNLNDIKLSIDTKEHHLCHAYCGFYTSSFNDALCIVMDGNGSFYKNGDNEVTEVESVYTFKNGKFKDTIFKRYCDDKILEEPYKKIDINTIDNSLDNKNKITQEMSVGMVYERSCLSIGMEYSDGGKLMGLSQYKNYKDNLPEEYNNQEWRDKVDISYKTQKYTEERILEFVKKYVNETGIKNVVLSGGVFLNCASNYNLVKNIPEINVHVDPMCSDNGISIGKCLLSYSQETDNIPSRIENSYLGFCENFYSVENCGLNYKKNITYSDIIDIILDGNVIALFQGKSEVGQRSLGNRSLLFDPRMQDGKTIVNKIKNRENYRPFAASILLEYADKWFNMGSLKESPSMSFAVDAYEDIINAVPSVIHVDGTCRIQTVTQKQNYHFYNLIKKFYDRTNVPMLLNTSFNLAGEPLVETFNDAISVMNNSELKYMYLPEIKTLIFK